ncbi:MAG TPA: copper-binding protein [Ramlibacter sp.]|jgi:Cu/Ag efflux protein CusF|nr:copper-binding protein [Ramlibacter sp.]
MKYWLMAAAFAAASAAHAAGPEWVRAKVVKVEPERSRLLLQHERIKSIDMDAMTMPFRADPSAGIERFKAGDRVRFTFVQRDGHLVVQKIEAAK